MRNPSRPHIDPRTGTQLFFGPLGYCSICTTPVSSQYIYCPACNSARTEFGDELPELVVPLTYAGSTGQSKHDVYKYKDVPPSSGAVRRLSILLGFFSGMHSGCIRRSTGDSINTVISVPSGQGREDHPLIKFRNLYFPASMQTAEARFVGAVRPTGHRATSIEPDDFAVSRSLEGEHVLIFEDTWVKGQNANALAIRAKRDGASRVSVLSIARLLDPSFGPTGQWMATAASEIPYDPYFCPVTRGDCP